MTETEHEPDGPEATEAAVEYAAEHGVDLAGITGTGADGRITKADVEEHLAKSAAPPTVEEAGDVQVSGDVTDVRTSGFGHAPKVWTGPQR